MKSMLRILAVLGIFLTESYSQIILPGRHPKEKIIAPPSDPNYEGIKASIQTAIQQLQDLGGGTLVLGAGVYYIESYGDDHVINLSWKSNITIVGDGDGTIFRQRSGYIASRFFYLNNSDNITIKNIRFEGVGVSSLTGDNVYHTAIQGYIGVYNLTIEGCSFKGFKTGGIKLDGINLAKIKGNFFDQVDHKVNSSGGDYGAIAISDAKNVIIEGNRFLKIRHSAISVGYGSNLTITGNIAHMDTASNRTMGIYVERGVQNTIISNNQLYDAKNEAIDVRADVTEQQTAWPIDRLTISGNHVTAKYAGIGVNNSAMYNQDLEATNVLVVDNTVSPPSFANGVKMPEHGIYIKRTTGSIVKGNIVNGADYGIHFSENPKKTIVTNNIVDNGNTGIIFGGDGMVKDNRVYVMGTGVSVSYSTASMITGNLVDASPRVYIGTNCSQLILAQNCSSLGTCN